MSRNFFAIIRSTYGRRPAIRGIAIATLLAVCFGTSFNAISATFPHLDDVRSPQQRPPVKQSSSSATATGPGRFSAQGLHYESVLMALYRGDFIKIEFNRDDIQFVSIFEQYLQAYGRRCAANLPRNKVEMTRLRCLTTRITRNGFGVEISRTCAEYGTEGTGIYADPNLYAAKEEVDRLLAGDALRNAFRILSQSDPAGATLKLAQTVISDMNALVQMNGCTSSGLRRFEENMRLFALNKQPIPLGGESSTPQTASAGPTNAQNFNILLDELIAEESRSWAVNRFIRGSVTAARVTDRDSVGRPAKVGAMYYFNDYNSRRTQGSVTVQFTNGLPECIHFFDFPNVCRTPNRRVVAAYAAGNYAESSGEKPKPEAIPLPSPQSRIPPPEIRQYATGLYVTVENTQVRSGPGPEFDAIAEIPTNTRIHVVATEGDWLKVESRIGNAPGYVEAKSARQAVNPRSTGVRKYDSDR